MKILHTVALIDDAMSMGGPLVGTQKQVLASRNFGHDSEIAAMTVEPFDRAAKAIETKGIVAHLFPAWRIRKTGVSGLLSLKYASWMFLQCVRYDVVHIHAGRDTASILAMACCWARRVPYISQTHGMIIPPSRNVVGLGLLDRLLVLPLLRRSAAVLALHEKEEESLRELRIEAGNIRRVRNGVYLPMVQSEPHEGPLTVVHVNRMSPRKRPEVFVEAAELVAESGSVAEYLMAGPDDGSLRLVQEAISICSHANIKYLGALEHSQALTLISRADLFVLTSINEPFPNALMEALAAGVPTIVTESLQMRNELEAAGAAEVVGHDARDVGVAMRRLLESEEERLKIGAAGRKFAESELSMEGVAARLSRLYEEAQTRKSP